MCGITVVYRRSGEPISASVVDAMTAGVAHRGPDGDGTAFFAARDGNWTSVDGADAWQLGFGHRRLAILDVSCAGRQPMSYRNGYWITYNGEVYNFVELREELVGRGHRFISHSDTEVILAAYAEWGPACFARFRGMWGLAIADLAAGKLIVSRDRLGIKPLYHYQVADAWYLVSEIKQLREAGVPLRVREETLGEYLLTGYEPSESTFFADVLPVAAGTWFEIDLRSGRRGAPQSYWNPESASVSIFDRDEAARAVRDALAQATRLQLRSDVPVGCALSGGLDSSSVAALAAGAADLHEPLNAFTVSFPGSPIDESRFAKLVEAAHRITPHVAAPSADDFLNDLDHFVWTHDEPVGSLSQYAGFALARLTRAADVPVTLNGQGGDETLLGYWQTYFAYLFGRLRRGRLPSVAAHFAGALLPGGNYELWRQLAPMLRRYRSRVGAADQLQLRSLERNHGDAGRRVVKHVLSLDGQARRIYEIRELHLPRLLKWDDRNLMAFSVEGRYPFLDHEFISVALSCDEATLFHRGWTKEPLRRGMRDLLPPELLRRREKFGFETPQNEWLCGPLRPTFTAWLESDSPLWSYVDRADASRVATLTWDSSGTYAEAAQALMRMFFADRWLRVCCDGDRRCTPTSGALQD